MSTVDTAPLRAGARKFAALFLVTLSTLTSLAVYHTDSNARAIDYRTSWRSGMSAKSRGLRVHSAAF